MFGGKKILAVIPARGGSKGLKGKNIREIHGKPMIQWTIEAALGSRYVDRLILSTDSAEIADVAQAAGCEVPFMRPDRLARDDSTTLDVIFHAIDTVGEGFDHLLLLQPTSPLRFADDIDRAIEICIGGGHVAITAVSIPPKPVHYFADVAPDGGMTLLPKLAEGTDRYLVNGSLYLIGIEALRRHRSFLPVGTTVHVMPYARSWDIDTLLDFRLCEAVMQAYERGEGGALEAERH